MKYIPSDKLKAEVKGLQCEQGFDTGEAERAYQFAIKDILAIITSLQQEQQENKQTIIITESHGDANIKWDCRSLSDVIAMLKSAESFITEKQIEKIAGPGSGPDYATTEGRYSHLFKHKREWPEVDLSEETLREEFHTIDRMCFDEGISGWPREKLIARHFYGLRNRALEKAARHVYESWMGGTMDDVRRDMVELGKVLNARKEGQK